MPFRYFGHTIRIIPCPERRDLFLADVTGPDGYEYGPMGIGATWLEAKHSGKKFVRDILAIVARHRSVK